MNDHPISARRATAAWRLPMALGLGLSASLLLGGCALFGGEKAVVPPTEDGPPASVIDPEIARREIKVPRIKSQDFELGLYSGVLNVEDLQSHLSYGARAAYHVTEDFFLEGEYARSEVSDELRRTIGQPFFPQQTLPLTSYGVSLGYNLLPGELFVGSRYATSSVLYLLAGAGDTHFNKEHYLTYNAGFGLKVLPRDWLVLRLEARDRMWQSDLLGADKLTHNFEMSFGIGAYF